MKQPPAAGSVFGDRLDRAQRYVEILADTGIAHGLIGPREGPRLWDRHVLNCAAVAELVEPHARVVDVGSGAGLPGIPLALARPDLEIVLVEPLGRRAEWLRRTVDELDLTLVVVQGRAEEPRVLREWRGADCVTARAVAPLERLTAWALPLLRSHGRLLALKGQSAAAELDRASVELQRLGGARARVTHCGARFLDPPSTVVVVERSGTGRGAWRPSGGSDTGRASRTGSSVGKTKRRQR